MRRRFIVSVVGLAIAVSLAFGVRSWRRPEKGEKRVDGDGFTASIGPLLDHSCLDCHGPKVQKGGLRLDSLPAALQGGKSGPALVPGDPGRSLLLQLARHTDPKRPMPKKGRKLTDKELALLSQWIESGAPWPATAPPEAPPPAERLGDAWSDARNPITRLFNGQRLDLWSFQPMADPSPPPIREAGWPRNPIDAFTLSRMESAGESPAPEASRRTLARRLYFDLTGLPPTPEQMTAFLDDPAPDAYSRLVESLLASPRYGEHWARLWLDVVRYSDSNGFDYDEFRPNAWRYRDYVVRSFNADKPYDVFVREQLAGDEMVDGPPQTAADQDRLIATGFLRAGPYDNSAVLFGEEDRCRAQVMFDIVETTGAAFLGLTLNCCRCHDHKTDPLSQADYYRLRAVFEGVTTGEDSLVDLAPNQEVITREKAELERLRQQVEAVAEPVVKRLQAEKTRRLPADDQRVLAMDPKDQTKSEKVRAKFLSHAIEPTPEELQAAFTDDQKRAHASATAALEEMTHKRSPFTAALIATESGATPPETRLLAQGDFTQLREVVPPGVLSALDPNPLPPAKIPRRDSSGRRTALAGWLCSPANPLTARVMVNRLWQGHFGTGLVATSNQFGFTGRPPADPALLDWLAREFIRSGWSVKKMHRLIVDSATYRQGLSPSEAADGQYWKRPAPQRLSAEAVRDALLHVSGCLLPQEGGPPLWPELPKEVIASSPGALIENLEKTRGWYPSPPEKTLVRSLYLVQKRSLHVPMLEAFDLPDNTLSCGRRTVSTVAPQALTLLNSSFTSQVSTALADRVLRDAGPAAAGQVERAFALALQRPPDAVERDTCLAFLHGHGLPELCRTLLNLNEFSYID